MVEFETEIKRCKSTSGQEYIEFIYNKAGVKQGYPLKSTFYYTKEIIKEYRDKLVAFSHSPEPKYGQFTIIAQLSLQEHLIFGAYASIYNKEPVLYFTASALSLESYEFPLEFLKSSEKFIYEDLYNTETVGFANLHINQ